MEPLGSGRPVFQEDVIFEDLDYILVTRDQPGWLAEKCGTAHRSFSAQPGVEGIRIGLEMWPREITYFYLVHRAKVRHTLAQINGDQNPERADIALQLRRAKTKSLPNNACL